MSLSPVYESVPANHGALLSIFIVKIILRLSLGVFKVFLYKDRDYTDGAAGEGHSQSTGIPGHPASSDQKPASRNQFSWDSANKSFAQIVDRVRMRRSHEKQH